MSIYRSQDIGDQGKYGYWDIAVAMFETDDFLRVSYADATLMLTPEQAHKLADTILWTLIKEGDI